MARSTYPRSADRHEHMAAVILGRHAHLSGEPIAFPVPIEMIIERTYGLKVVYETIEEPSDAVILGALEPANRRIIINSAHEDLLGRVVGPERFTLGHELAHWVYDAENPDQMTLDLPTPAATTFCYYRESPTLPESDRIREINANKLAACLLLPECLVRAADIPLLADELRDLARTWGVSYQALAIRLDGLGLN